MLALIPKDPLPWSVCPLNSNHTGYDEECEKASSTQYFWYRKTLNISPSIQESGPVQWEPALCLILAWLLVYLCILRGTESTGKVDCGGGGGGWWLGSPGQWQERGLPLWPRGRKLCWGGGPDCDADLSPAQDYRHGWRCLGATLNLESRTLLFPIKMSVSIPAPNPNYPWGTKQLDSFPFFRNLEVTGVPETPSAHPSLHSSASWRAFETLVSQPCPPWSLSDYLGCDLITGTVKALWDSLMQPGLRTFSLSGFP